MLRSGVSFLCGVCYYALPVMFVTSWSRIDDADIFIASASSDGNMSIFPLM